ncbi:hypothetical protein HYPSUDRAFT_213213 [Hypholoma sublateritium FD-334 SS-4]|uniref:Uncharacterized protein n=1 Tax=Hypholoma sublateritium (strain FD-334 SS-4) TaxID=945553 RepID=A0A0D2LGC8_HYPSF|nr:hypothetical protein HYPSUDRAFT_213213 [Hypholoma sublateritium FD-334 SS-4]
MPGGKAHPAQKASKLPKAIPAKSPDPNIPGAYPSSPDPSSTMHGQFVEQDHRGHDHRPLFKVDLPTHEQPSGSREGVGSLPGPNTERGVAILPDERPHAHQKVSSHGFKDRDKNYELPTSEIPSGSDVGIGSMPGNIWESGVATLPEERIHGRPYGQGHTGFEDSLDTDWKSRHLRDHDGTEATPENDSETLQALSPIPPPSHQRFVEPQAASHLMEDTSETVRNIATQVEHVAGDVVGAVEGVAAGMYNSAGAILHNIGAHWPASEHAEAEEEHTESGLGPAHRNRKPTTGTQGSPLKSGGKVPHSKLPRPSAAVGTESKTSRMPSLPSSGNVQDEGTAVGLGGVEFYTEGKDGVLPGFPTAGGMGVLIADRVNDDRLRSEAARNRSENDSSANRVQLHRGESTASNRAVDGSISSLSSSAKEDTANEFQITEEKREVPVFMDGSESASGKYEAVFEPVDRVPGERQNDDKRSTDLLAGLNKGRNERSPEGREGSTPTGQSYQTMPPQIPASQTSLPEGPKAQFALQADQGSVPGAAVEAPFSANLPSPIISVFDYKGPHSHPQIHESGPAPALSRAGVDVGKGKSEVTQGSRGLEDTSKTKLPPTLSTGEARSPASYLGKPISKEEEKNQVEKARLLSRKKAGVN